MDMTAPIYSDENKAREHLEKLLWPEGPFCPHCGNADPERIHKLAGKSTRPGVYKCRECEKPFSVTVNTVFELSHVPLNKWLYVAHKLNSGKKGTSAHQIHREIGVSYKTAWFMCHRIREAMTPTTPTPMGGEGKTIEADETEIGGKAKNRRYGPVPKKAIVLSLVERGGAVRSTRVASVSPKSLRPAVVRTVSRKSRLMTDMPNGTCGLGRNLLVTKVQNMARVNTSGATPIPTLSRIIFRSSNAAFMACITMSVLSICRAT